MTRRETIMLTAVLVLGALLLLTSCESLDSVMKGADTVRSVSSRTSSTAAKAEPVDLRSGEMLCAYTDRPSIEDNNYKAAKIITPASDSTNNQAEVLFANGDQVWTGFVIASHKASKSELTVGTLALYMPYYSDDEKVSAEEYRSNPWKFGRVTSTDEFFKDMVEINGKPKYIKWVRVPDEPVK